MGNLKRNTKYNQEKQDRLTQFANTVKQWNKSKINTASFLIMITMLAILYVITINLLLVPIGFRLTFVLSESMLVFPFIVLGFIYAYTYCNGYTTVTGKQGRISQPIYECIYHMPFSIKDYYKEIGRRFVKIVIGVGTAMLCLFISGTFFSLILWKPAEEMVSPEVLLQQITISGRFSQGLLLCAAETLLLTGAMAAGFYTQQWIHLRKYRRYINGLSYRIEKKQKIKKSSGRQNTFWSEHQGLLYIVIIFGSLLVAGIMCFRSFYLRVPDGIEVYRAVTNGTRFTSMLMVSFMFMAEEISHFFRKEKVDKKKAAICLLVMIFTPIYCFSFYDTYYEDRIESKRFFYTKEYKWQDVTSYTVKASPFTSSIQLKLNMGDKILSVMSGDKISSIEHDDSYYNDYLYGAYLVKKMDALGIPGTLKDLEKIEALVEEWDQEEKDAVEEIKRIVPRKE